MSNAYIIVDDQDAQLNYTGQWSVAGAGSDYGQSVHASNVSASSMAFRFTGTSISLIGNLDAGGSCSVAVSLDGDEHKFNSPSVTATSHQQTIWSSTRLADTNHTLLYSVESCSGNSSSDPYLWFDYILYEPSSNAPSGAKYFIDDTSGQVEWNGQWTQNGEDGDFNSTRHVLQKDASLRLKFTGSKASVYGRVDSNVPTQAAFSLDGGDAEIFNAPSSNVVQHNVEFFSSNTLDQTEHTLVMTARSDAPVSIDYFIVRSNPATKNDPGIADGHSGPPTSIIIGAAVGGAVLLAALALAFWFFRRKWKAPTSKTTSKPDDTGSFYSPSYPPTPSAATFHYSTEQDMDPGSPTTFSSSARPSTHARMRSVHKHHSDEEVLYSDPRREHHMSMGASSSSSSGQYTESDVYAVYDDPFHVPSPTTIGSHGSVSSKTSLVRGQRTDSLPSEFGSFVPRRKSKMQSVVTSSEAQSEISYDLPSSPPGYATRFPTSVTGSHMSTSDMSTTSRQTVLHALDPSEGYFPPLSDLKKRTLSTDLHNVTVNEYNDYFLPPTRYGKPKVNPATASSSYAPPNPAFASTSHRHSSTSSGGSSRPLPDPRNYQAASSDDGRSLSERDAKRPPDGLLVLSVDGLSTSGSVRRAPVVHRDSGFRMYTPEPSEGHSSHSHSHMEEEDMDIPDELPPVYTPR